MYFYENPIVNTVLYAVEITIQRAVLYELGTIFRFYCYFNGFVKFSLF